MKADPVNIKGTRFTTTRLTHRSRHTECVLMIRHIKGDIEKKTKFNTLQIILDLQQIDPTLKSFNVVQNQVRTMSSDETPVSSDETPRLTTDMILF